MPRTIWTLVTIVLVCAAARAGEFPFTGYVGVDRAEVASGPGRRFYTTDRLPRGTEIEVFQEDDSGWLAVRPPEGSFSWIPAEQVEIDDEADVGKVKAATPCWIGTNIERVEEHRSLVTLKPGELVQVLDRRTVAGSGGTEQTWLKIAPPAGEFRYIHGRDVSREPVAEEPRVGGQESGDGERGTGDREQEVGDRRSEVTGEFEEPERLRPMGSAMVLDDLQAVRERVQAARDKLQELAEGESEGAVEQAQFRSSVGQESDRTISPDGFVPRKRRSSEPLDTVPVPSSNLTRGSGPTFSRPKLDPPARLADSRPAYTAATGRNSGIGSDDVARQLEQFELELSLMLSEDRSTWNLAGLRQKVEALVENGARPADRGSARLLLDKIKQFEETFDVRGYGPITAAPAATAATPPDGVSAADPRYDGTGWLKPVISRSKPAAPFALVDADGKPLLFVTPSPGLNLNRYVNKQVGIYGRRGYMESLKTPHVTAERVIDLERQWR